MENKAKQQIVQAKLKKELMAMSFTNDQIDAAFLKAKQFKIEELVDIICLSTAEEAKNPAKVEVTPAKSDEVVTWSPYNCDECTFRNEEEPGPQCSICGGAAPASAKVIKISEQQVAANLKKEKEEEETKKAAEREEKKLMDEQKKQ